MVLLVRMRSLFSRGSMSGDRDNFVLPAFALAKGLDGLLPVFQHALMKSSPENRAIAARGIGTYIIHKSCFVASRRLQSSINAHPFLICCTLQANWSRAQTSRCCEDT